MPTSDRPRFADGEVLLKKADEGKPPGATPPDVGTPPRPRPGEQPIPVPDDQDLRRLFGDKFEEGSPGTVDPGPEPSKGPIVDPNRTAPDASAGITVKTRVKRTPNGVVVTVSTVFVKA